MLIPRSAKRFRLCWVNTMNSGLFKHWNCSMEYIPSSNLLYTKRAEPFGSALWWSQQDSNLWSRCAPLASVNFAMVASPRYSLATLPCSVRLRLAASRTAGARLRRPIDVNDVLYHSGSSAWNHYGGFRPTSEPLIFELTALYHILWPDAIASISFQIIQILNESLAYLST